MKVQPIEGAPFGVEVHGVDLARDLNDDVMRELVDLLYEERVVVVRDQKLTKDQYMTFGRQWGAPIPHVLDHLRDRDFPAMMEVGNVREAQKADNVRNGAAFWHTDQSYEAVPANVTMLYCIHGPKVGGETLIADQKSAMEALPQDLMELVRDRDAWHLYGAASGRDGEEIAAGFISEAQKSKVPPVLHRVLRPHPVTGRPTLYGMAGTPIGLEGMDEPSAQPILADLKKIAVAPERVYRHRHVPGSILIYDTNQTLHSGTPVKFAETDDDRRLLWRISIRDLPAVVQDSHAA